MPVWLGAALLFGALSLLGYLDYNAERRDVAQYCENVKNRIWPDFKGIYKTDECKDFRK